jgi:hypothetical protein
MVNGSIGVLREQEGGRRHAIGAYRRPSVPPAASARFCPLRAYRSAPAGRLRLTGPIIAQTDDVFRVFQLLGGTQRELASDKVFIAQLTDPASPVVDVLRHRNQGPRRQASVREMASPKKCVAPARVLMVMGVCACVQSGERTAASAAL